MPGFRVCVCFLVRAGAEGGREVLLGVKKTGLGSGKIVGLGGKLESGELAVDAIIREVQEESGVVVARSDLEARGHIEYSFPFRESWTQESAVFIAERFEGEPAESDEISPKWYPVDSLPTDQMWDDAKHWLPAVLAGGTVEGWFEFGPDCESVSDSRLGFSGIL